MFIRYEFDKTQVNNTTQHTAFMQDLFDAINGTITDPANFTSTYCNKELSEIHGSVTWGTANTDLYDSVYKGSTDFRFKKYHNSRDNSGSYEPAGIIGLYWATGGRPSIEFKTKDDNTFALSSSTNRGTYWTPDTASNQAPGGVYGGVGYDRVLIFASAFWFVIQIYVDNRIMTGGIFDFEDSAADIHAYSLDDNTAPQMFFANDVEDMRSGNTSQQTIYWGRHTYMSTQGSILQQDTDRSPDEFLGNVGSYSNYTPSIFPTPRISQSPGKIANGNGHFLTPVFVVPTQGGSSNSMSSFGKIPYLYRTTDDLAQGGDLITYNSIDYMSLPMHKTGAATVTSQPKSANYLLPKLIGGA